MNLPIFMESFAGLNQTATTGKPIMDFAGFMEHFAAEPEESSIFNQAMADKSRGIIPAVLDALVDLGDRRSAALQQSESFRGVRLDAPA